MEIVFIGVGLIGLALFIYLFIVLFRGESL
jgi:K+-transporting ATPase KdpF subunit